MKLSVDDSSSAYTIRGYGDAEVVINDETFRTSVVVTPRQLLRDWGPQRFEELDQEHLADLMALEPEVILLGTGARTRFPHGRLLALAAERRIGLEVMDTPAACRTFNILAAEGRNVAAALLML